MSTIETAETPSVIPAHKKTATDRADDLAILEAELAKVSAQAGQVDFLGKRVQEFTSANLLGNKTLADLAQAQRDLDEAVAAINRKATLQLAVAEARDSLNFAQSQERQQFVKGIETEYQDVYARYVARSKDVLGLFRELQRLDQQYRGMARSGSLPHLLDSYHRELNLPAVTGMLSARSGFTTGQD